MYLNITPDELRDAAHAIYGPCQYRHAPSQIFFDHFDGLPRTTFIRAAFPEKFTAAGAAKLNVLVDLLEERHGPFNVVVCVYYHELDRDDLARHSIAIADR